MTLRSIFDYIKLATGNREQRGRHGVSTSLGLSRAQDLTVTRC